MSFPLILSKYLQGQLPRFASTHLLLPTRLVLGILRLLTRHRRNRTPNLPRIHILQRTHCQPSNLLGKRRVERFFVESFENGSRDLLCELDKVVLGFRVGFCQIAGV